MQDVAWVSAQLEQAQRHFALIDTSFEVIAADTLPASDLEIDDRDERDALGHIHPLVDELDDLNRRLGDRAPAAR